MFFAGNIGMSFLFLFCLQKNVETLAGRQIRDEWNRRMIINLRVRRLSTLTERVLEKVQMM